MSVRLGRRTDGTLLDVGLYFSPANVGPFDSIPLVLLRLGRRTDGAMLDVGPNDVVPAKVGLFDGNSLLSMLGTVDGDTVVVGS